MASILSRIHSGATVTTSGSSPVFSNQGGHRRHQLNVVIRNAPTGTTPTLQFKVMVSSDGISFAQKGGALATLNAIGAQRTPYGPGTVQGAIVENFVRVDWTITGASASFTGVSTTFQGMDC